VVYQEVRGQRREVAGNFVLRGPHRIGFVLGPYDHSQPLVIDPTLAYSTYLGGNYQDSGTSIAVDSSGNVYVTGYTGSTNFPTVNALQATDNGGTSDAFVTKLNASGSALDYSTYLGGNDADYGYGIAVDSSGNAYVTGSTHSTNFPTVNPIQATDNGFYNAFIAKLDPSGSALVYSTYLGGSHDDYGYGIAVDSSGSAYVTGSASSTNFPTVNAFQAACGGGGEGGCPGYTDAFVAKLNPAGSALIYSTYMGGSYTDYGTAIAVDSSGDAYVTGFTASYVIASVPGSTNFPTANPFQATCGGTAEGLGCGDAFVAELNPTGSALVYSTYLGGSAIEDYGYGIAVDSSGNAYVTGATASTDFPVANPLQPTNTGDGDAFVTKVNAAGSALVYSTYLGGSGGGNFGNGIAVDSSGNAYVTGYTESAHFPTANPPQGTLGGSFDAFVTKFDPAGSALVYSTYLGGSNDDQGNGIAVDSSGNAYVTGFTYSTNFPTVSPLQKTNSATYGTAFIAKISQPTLTLSPTTLAAGTAGALYSPVTFTATGGQGTVTISESGNLPSGMTFSNGTLAGTPTQTGNYPIIITATDSQSDT
ncbi:MAG: SBBP repeat-containing protein, partial [Candidatus Sulfotelmatobacter sp.]